MAGIEKRIADLERLYGTAPYEDSEAAEERERQQAQMRATLEHAEEKAAAEEAEGNLNRRRALDSIYRFMNRETD